MIRRLPVLLAAALALAGCATVPDAASNCTNNGKGNQNKMSPRVCVSATLNGDGSATFNVDPYVIVASENAPHIVFESRNGEQIDVVMKHENCTLDRRCNGKGDCRLRVKDVEKVERCSYAVALLLADQWIVLDPIIKIDTD